jgi:hypothetical protein
MNEVGAITHTAQAGTLACHDVDRFTAFCRHLHMRPADRPAHYRKPIQGL